MKSTNNKGAAMIQMTVDQFDVATKRVVIIRHDESDETVPDGFPFGYAIYDIGEDLPYEANIGWDTADGARQAAVDVIDWIAVLDAKESR